MPDPKKRRQGKLNRDHGKHSEGVVKNFLKAFGLGMVEKINTAFQPTYKNGKPSGGYWQEQCSGDFRAVAMGGVSCLIEVKKRQSAKFSLSAFEDHQIKALDHHNSLGGLSLVTWVTQARDIYLMRWPMPILARGRPITEQEAKALADYTAEHWHEHLGHPWSADYYHLPAIASP